MEKKYEFVYGGRKRLAIKFKSVVHTIFKGLQLLTSKITKDKNYLEKEIILIVVGLKNSEDIKDFLIRLHWYLPVKSLNVKFLIDNRNQLNPELFNDLNYEFVISNSDHYAKSHKILLAQWDYVFSFELLKYLYKVLIIDIKYYSYVESLSWQNLYYNCLSESSLVFFKEIASENFTKFMQEKSGKTEATCFVTGPTFSNYENFEYKNHLIVICNSIVKNKQFLQYTNGADLLVFSDPVFHFSFNEYSVQFRENTIEAFKNYRFFIAIPNKVFPLIYYHYPELRENLIGVDYNKLPGEYNIPSLEGLWVKDNGNVLTNFMIPFASAVAKSIFIIGADGRQPNEKYFWSHNPTVQYDGLMSKVFDGHPSFFRDRDYKDYYNQHCICCEELSLYVENYGRNIHSLTFSNIPAFQKRIKN